MKKKKLMLLLACCCFFMAGSNLGYAQSSRISGRVSSSETGEPIIGASVMIKGSNSGTITDTEGLFTITIPSPGSILVISYIGMKQVEIVAKDGMNIKLENSSEALEEVLVVAYGTAKKSAFTGSSSVVKADKLSKIQSASVSKALEGAASGVQISSSSGAPGSDASVRIRGLGSINASSAPLYIVDGVPFSGNLSSINQQDIESVTVLKDAAANSLYGSRGANGVILITTKRGDKGNAKITFEAKIGVTQLGISPYDVISSEKDYYELAWESLRNNNYYKLGDSYAKAGKNASERLTYELGNYNSYDVNGDGVINNFDNQNLINFSNGQLNPNARLMYSEDWMKAMFQSGMRQEYNASASGGNDELNYYFSVGSLSDEGYVTNSSFNRYSSRLKIESRLKDWVKLGANFSYSRENINWLNPSSRAGTNMFFLAQTMAPIYPIHRHDNKGEIMRDEKGNVIYDFGDAPPHDRPVSSMANPVGEQVLNKNIYHNNNLGAKAFLEFRFLKDFKLTANLSAENVDGMQNNYLNGLYGQFANSGGVASRSVGRTTAINANQLLSWIKDIGLHNLDVLLGHEYYGMRYESIYAKKEKILDPLSDDMSGAIMDPQADSYKQTYNIEGYFSRLQYNYNSKYFASASFRTDASSRFAPGKRRGYFWALGGSWRIDKEDFMSDVDFVDELRIKSSYGTQGNDNLLVGGATPYLDQYKVVNFEDNFSVEKVYRGNPDITWEKNENFNIGLAFALFDKRLEGSLEYFQRKTKDMLFSRPLATSSGDNSYPDNIGTMLNRGIELELDYNVLKYRNFNWDISLNATHFTNIVTELPPESKEDGIVRGGTFKLLEGKSIYEYYIREFAGVNSDGLPTWYMDKAVTDPATGATTTTKGTTSEYSDATKYFIGESAIPTVFGGIGTTISLYGFDLSIQANYQIGGKGYDAVYQELMNPGKRLGYNWHKDIFKRWQEEAPSSEVPRLQVGNQQLSGTSTQYLIDASFFNIKNITLAYNIPSKLLNKVHIESFKVYGVVDNLALFSKRQGYDPRLNFYGESGAGAYSVARTVSFGLNLTF